MRAEAGKGGQCEGGQGERGRVNEGGNGAVTVVSSHYLLVPLDGDHS